MPIILTDGFAGTAAPLTTPWTQVGLAAPTINTDGSGRAKQSAISVSDDIIVYDGSNTYSNDQYSQIQIISGLGAIHYGEVFVRCSGTGGSFAGYQFLTNGSPGNGNTELFVYSGGSATHLLDITATFGSNDIMKISAVGNLITCYQNGTSVASITDSTLTVGAAGFGMYNDSTTVLLLDNFEGGNTGASAAITGTATTSITESQLLGSDRTIIITLTGDTWIPL